MPSPRIMMYFICNSFIVFSKASPPTMLCASYRPRPRSHRTRKTPVPQRRPPPSSLFPAVGIEESSGRNHAAGAGAYRILAMLMISANTPAAVTLGPGSVALDLHRVLLVPLGRQQNHVVAAGQVIERTLAIHLAQRYFGPAVLHAGHETPAQPGGFQPSGGAARNRRPPRESGARTPRPTPRNTSRE